MNGAAAAAGLGALTDRVGGRYRLDRQLGAGGMGEVYVAYDERLERPVALKFQRVELGDADAARGLEFQERFRNEAVAACRIHHPAVIEIYDADVHNGVPWIAMELLEGETLAAVLQRRKLTVAEAAWVALETLEGLAAVHEAGFVHRDLKPENIYLQRVGRRKVQLKLLDFGIVKQVSGAMRSLTRTGSTIGTPWYVSPEQAAGSRDIDHRSDLYSLAVVIYECLTLAHPLGAESFGELVSKFYTQQPRPLAELAPDVPDSFAALIAQCLALSPDDRPPDANALAERFDALAIQPAPIVPAPPTSAHASPGSTHPLGTLALAPGDRPDARLPTAERAVSGTVALGSSSGTVALPPRESPRGRFPWILALVAAGALALVITAGGAAALAWTLGGEEADEGTFNAEASEPPPVNPLSDDPGSGPATVLFANVEPTDGAGALEPSIVDFALAQRRAAVTHCYARQLSGDPNRAGSAATTLTVEPDGRVAAAVEGELGTCVHEGLDTLRFTPGPARRTEFRTTAFFGFESERNER